MGSDNKIEANLNNSENNSSNSKGKGINNFFKNNKVIVIIAALLLFIIVFGIFLYPYVIIPNQKYNKAIELFEKGEYKKAEDIFTELGLDYKDCAEKIKQCELLRADAYVKKGNYKEAFNIYTKYSDDKKVKSKLDTCISKLLEEGINLFNKGEYSKAKDTFSIIESCSKEAAEYIKKCDAAIEEQKAAEKARKKAEADAKRASDPVIGTWYLSKVENFNGLDLTSEYQKDISKYYVTFNVDGTGIFQRGNIATISFTWEAPNGNSPRYKWTVGSDTDYFFVYNDPLVEMDITNMSDILGKLVFTFTK